MTDSTPLSLLDAALRGTLLALLLLLAGMLARDRPRLAAARTGVALMLGLCVQVVSSTPRFEALVPRVWQAPLVAVAVANAVLFWVFVQALFDDGFRLRPWHVAAWLAVAGLSGFNCALGPAGAMALGPWPMGMQRAMPLLFSVLAALAAARQWRSDLVEPRRRLRAFIVVTGIFYTLAMLAVRLASAQGRLSDTAATLDVAALLFMIAVVAWRLLRLTPSELFPLRLSMPLGVSVAEALAATLEDAPAPARDDTEAPSGPPASPDPAETRLAASLQRLMAQERIYRNDDLSVASLAARLAVPEYRLRRLINQRLGHRNFNAYINGFRLDEARIALADPARRALPVLTIALDAGFQSIGPFNRAFKAATGLTPTEFRQQNLADS